MENLTLKNTARSLMVAGFITFSAVGIAIAAGAGDQTGQRGDMSGHGGPVDKKAGSAGGQKSGPAPEPSTYRQSGAAGSGYSGGAPSLEPNNSSSGEGKRSQGDGTTNNAGKGTGGQDDSYSMSSRKKGVASPVQGAGTTPGSSQGSGSFEGSSGSGGK